MFANIKERFLGHSEQKPAGREVPWPILLLEPSDQVKLIDEELLPRTKNRWKTDLLLTGAGLLVARAGASLVEPGFAQDILVWGGLLESSLSFYLSSETHQSIRVIEGFRAMFAKNAIEASAT